MSTPEEVLFSKLGSEPYAKFALGQLVATPGAIQTIGHEEILVALGRHARGDWGELDAGDRRENERSLADEGRLFSVYHSRSGVKFWVITEADRSSTCVLLPEEY